MGDASTLSLVAFISATSLALLLWLLVTGRKSRMQVRLEELSGRRGRGDGDVAGLARATAPRLAAALVPPDDKGKAELKTRLVQAGLYKRSAMTAYLAIKMLLTLAPVAAGAGMATVGLIDMTYGILFGALAGIFGTIAPSFWLDYKKSHRQVVIRRSIPDAMDVIVICLEGGLSLQGSFSRVATELRTAHSLLATELMIVQREIQMGRATGEALKMFADRFDVEELRSLASVITQAERFGASVIKALRVHADALRLKRQQRAEEMAQKAGTKMLFPTLLFILPPMFVVILGPAAIQIVRIFEGLTR